MKKYYIFFVMLFTACLLLACGEKTTTNVTTTTTTTNVQPTIQPTVVPTSTTTVAEVDHTAQVKSIKFLSETFNYDGQAHTIEATNIPDGYSVTYENNSATEKGTHTAVCNVWFDGKQVGTIKSTILIDHEINQEFQEVLDEFFLLFLDDDCYSWNVFVNDQSLFNYVRPEGYTPSWYSYEHITDEEYELWVADYVYLLGELAVFDDAVMPYTQLEAKISLEKFLRNSYNYYSSSSIDPLMELNYIDSFGGYVANFTQCVTNYTFRNEQDVKDMLSYTLSTDEAFETYITYMEDKVNAGYPISDTTLDGMNEYLLSVLSGGENYYLYQYLANTINGLDFLDDAKKESYIEQYNDALTNHFLVGVKTLSDSIETFKGNKTDNMYLSTYGDAGKELYKNLLEDALGIENIDMDEYIKYIDDALNYYKEKFEETSDAISSLSSKDRGTANGYINGTKSLAGSMDPDKSLEYLKEFAKTLVPDLKSNPEIEFAYMDETLAAVSNAVAYYTKSTLDGNPVEKITLNSLALGNDKNATLATIAHEGYPGHLFAYVYSKERNLPNVQVINSNTGHAEGWTKYIEAKLYDYISANATTNKKPIKAACDYLKYYEYLVFALYTKVDVMVNYQGKKVSDVASLLSSLGLNSSAAQDVVNTLVEIPTQYATYGYGMIRMTELHEYAQNMLGDLYDEIEFNMAVHSYGWVGYDQLTNIVEKYILNVYSRHGILNVGTN